MDIEDILDPRCRTPCLSPSPLHSIFRSPPHPTLLPISPSSTGSSRQHDWGYPQAQFSIGRCVSNMVRSGSVVQLTLGATQAWERTMRPPKCRTPWMADTCNVEKGLLSNLMRLHPWESENSCTRAPDPISIGMFGELTVHFNNTVIYWGLYTDGNRTMIPLER